MKFRKSMSVLEILFFALALVWFIPVIKSDPSPYGYWPETAFVSVSILISRMIAYRSGRGLVRCALEVVIVSVIFVLHRYALNLATVNGM
jgi:hypothetical protein